MDVPVMKSFPKTIGRNEAVIKLFNIRILVLYSYFFVISLPFKVLD